MNNQLQYPPPSESPAMQEKNRAIEAARAVLAQPDDGGTLHLLARQLLRALALPER